MRIPKEEFLEEGQGNAINKGRASGDKGKWEENVCRDDGRKTERRQGGKKLISNSRRCVRRDSDSIRSAEGRWKRTNILENSMVICRE